MPNAYAEDQQAPRTLTQPLPAGEVLEQPAFGLFAEQSALPNPQPGLPATLLPVREGTGDAGAQLALPPEAMTAAGDGYPTVENLKMP